MSSIITIDPLTPLPVILRDQGLWDGAMGEDYHKVEDKVIRTATPILTVDDSGTLEVVGSGFVIAVKGKYFLFTAGHVLNFAINKLLYIYDRELIGKGTELLGDYYMTLPEKDNHKDDPLDFGFIEISQERADGLRSMGFEIIPIEAGIPAEPISDFTRLFAGFPASKSKSIFGTKTVRFSSIVLSTMALTPSQEFLDKGFSIEKNLFLAGGDEVRFTKKGVMGKPPDFYGISGGPVWSVAQIAEWVAGKRSPVFIGIFTGGNRSGNIQSGTRIGIALLHLFLFHPAFEEERIPIIDNLKVTNPSAKFEMGRFTHDGKKLEMTRRLVQDIEQK